MDRFNRDIVDIALSLEDGDVVELHSYMCRSFPYRVVSERYKHGNYHTNAEAIVLSTWANRKAYIMCGAPGYGGVPSNCHQTFVCEQCCKKAAARMYVRYQNSFNQAQHWYALTYSFKTNVFLDTASQADFLARYKVADSFIRSLRAAGLIHGAVAVREISVNSFQGKAVFPHTHVVANSDRVDLINEDGSYHPVIAEEAERAGVSIKLTRITDSGSFLTQLKYPLKPINIKSLYEQEAINHRYNDINLGLDIILNKLTAYGKGTPRIVYYGNMDARCKSYIGTDMNRQLKTKRAQARLQASATKELNSCGTSPKMVSVQLTPATISMPIAPQSVAPPQVQPPQKKKFWGPLALGLGAGVAGLGAYDQFANHGRATSSLINHIKSIFSKNPEAAVSSGSPTSLPIRPPRKPVTLGPARTEGDVIADAAAGHIGSGVNPAGRGLWKDWIALQRAVGEATAFNRVPGEVSVAAPSPLATGALSPADVNLSSGENMVGYASKFLQGNSPSPASAVADKTVDLLDSANNSTGLGLLGAAGVAGSSALGAKALPALGVNAPKLTGALTRAGKMLDTPATKTLFRGVSAGAGGSLGYRLGANPLTVEYFMDKFPNLTPEQAAAMAKSTYAGVGAGAAARLPLIGPAMLMAENGLADRAVDQIRGMSGSTAERGAVADLLTRLHRGARAGVPQYRVALENVLKHVDSNQQLTDAIAGKQNPWYKRWPVWEDNDGSPALQSLINKSRQAIIQ